MVPWAGHLWFLVFLLWFSLAGLPLLVMLHHPRGRRLAGWLGQHAHRRGAILWWAVPLALVHAALRAPGPIEHGWGEFVVFFDLFLAGALLLADQRLVGAVRRDLRPALYLAVTGTPVLGATAAAGLLDRWPADYSWTSVGMNLVLTVWAWAWILAALAVGLRASRFQRPLPRAVGDAAMPFFLVHQPVILAIAFVVVQWQAGIAVKLPVLLATSLVVSTVLAVVLSRLPHLSTLLGVKLR